MAELPSGTLTFLFTDIEGSTHHLQALGPRWDEALDQHHRLLRAAVAAHGGTEVATEGDSFFVAFPVALDAVAAAAEAQRALAEGPWPDGADIRVRMGLHSGTASLAGGSYAGLDVHRAARIMSAAHGGQVLLSDVTRALVGPELPEGLGLRDVGEHRLKDLGAAERLHQLVVDGLEADFPAPRTLGAAPNNLPVQLTTFLGREREIAEVDALLGRARLVTLTGPGGTGKTRLSLQVAAQAGERFPDGVWFVDLAPITDPELVVPTIARELGVREHPGRSPLEGLQDHLAGRRALLVLDNFEQVDGAAPVISQLLSGTREVCLLVTSRTVLRLGGEQEYPVPPLGLPDPRHLDDEPERIGRYEAVALFVERARAARPGFELDERNAAAVAEICLRLDGLPLAIELAAARVRLLPPEAILERLGQRLELLTGGPRDLPERQQTLRGAIEWSHDLLDEDDRRLFAALSVFVGGASLGAVEQICGAAADEPSDGVAPDGPGDVLDGLASLVDKSLVRQEEGADGQPRFRLLETIREFALDQSTASGRHGQLQRRHAEWFAELAERDAPRIMGPDQREVLDRLDQEHANLRAAIGWSIESGRADLALRLCARLWRMWHMRGHLTEGMERVRRALEMPAASEHPELRADALEAAGGLAYWKGELGPTHDWYAQALEARRALGDRSAIAEALYNLSFAFVRQVERKPPTTEGATPEHREHVAAARRIASEAVELFRELGDESGMARTQWMLATVDAVDGDFEAQEAGASQASEAFTRLGDRFHLAWALWSVAFARLGLGRPEDAREPVRQALEIFAAADDLSGCLMLVEMAAMVADRTGEHARAARLAAAVSRAEAATGLEIYAFPRTVLDFDHDRLRRGETADAWQEGSRMDVPEAIADAQAFLAASG